MLASPLETVDPDPAAAAAAAAEEDDDDDEGCFRFFPASAIFSGAPLKGVPCVPISVPDSICRRSRVYRMRAAGGLRFVMAATAAKSIFSRAEVSLGVRTERVGEGERSAGDERFSGRIFGDRCRETRGSRRAGSWKACWGKKQRGGFGGRLVALVMLEDGGELRNCLVL